MESTTRAADRRQTMAVVLAALLGLALVAAMITRTSEAAFTATTDNTGNSFTAGTLTLTDNDAGSALFAITDMAPGDSESKCIVVTYTGSVAPVANPVVIYSGGYVNVAGNLSDYLNVTVDEGTGSAADCSDFTLGGNVLATTTLTSFAATNLDYASGLGTWTPSATNETNSYRVTVALDAATPDAEQGSDTDTVNFVWEVQN